MKKNTPIVTIKKKKYPVYFGMAALSDFENTTGIPLNDLEKYASGMSLDNTIQLAYLGLKHGARRMKEECAFANHLEVADFLDDDPSLISEVMNVFTEQYAPKNSPNTAAKKK